LAQTLRNKDGRFASGNPGGPGRPRLAVERDYLRALSDACPIVVWEKIVKKAVVQAQTGDAGARAWLGKYLLNNTTLAASSSNPVDMIDEFLEQQKSMFEK
jgi:hypothetical protein